MKDLIERLEKATGRDIRLDAEILCAVEPRWYQSPAAVPPWCHTIEGECCAALPYTASIDAALTLVPAGCVWALNFASMATIMKFGSDGVLNGRVIGQWPADQREAEQRISPAIALCIAALKARDFAERDLTNMEASNG